MFGILTLLGGILLVSDPAMASTDPSWYTRYEKYHPYCSIPEEMERRGIPPLQDPTQAFGESRLLQSTLIIRHGARTPWSGDIQCWDGYATMTSHNPWNCNLTTIMAPPSPSDIEQQEGNQPNGKVTSFLFEKQYNALYTPPALRNEFYGTCQKGQLLLRGYEQEIANGKHVRDAYLYNSQTFDHDVRMRLIDIGQDKTPWNSIYYRADDDQRTTMSGQVLLRGMFEPEMETFTKETKLYPKIPMHTADRSRDVLDPNESICPRLREMRERIYRSNTFVQFNNSREAQELRSFLQEDLGVARMDSIDCLMTTMCTDRELPKAVDDYDQEHGFFQRLFDFDTNEIGMVYTANDAEYAKLSMGPLWAEIFTNVDGILFEEDEVCCPRRSTPKLAVFSGHDTTIMPLLASIGAWDGSWPPYASLVALEIHRVHIDGTTDKALFRSNFAFRLLYNGDVITDRVTGCAKGLQLCDAQILRGFITTFASRENLDCTPRYAVPVVYEDTISRAVAVLSTPGGVVSFVLLVVVCLALGAGVMFVHLTGRIPVVPKGGRGGLRRPKRRQYETVSSDGVYDCKYPEDTSGARSMYVDEHDDDDDSGARDEEGCAAVETDASSFRGAEMATFSLT